MIEKGLRKGALKCFLKQKCPSKDERKEAFQTSTGSPFHKAGAIAKKAQFLVAIFLVSLELAT